MGWNDKAKIRIDLEAARKKEPYITEIVVEVGCDYVSCVDGAHEIMKRIGFEKKEYTIDHFVG